MATLTQEKCVACRRDSPRVTDEEVAELHPQVADWELTNSDGIPRLQRTFRFRDFGGALDFATQLGRSAGDEGHHPRITVEWGRVGVDWWTHKIRGLHRNDFIMAAKTDAMYADADTSSE
ncbi:MAG: 4a-hydroxytetrahydrobiopterin dehydratase [Chloroflexi bacterium]|nr:4a-hydroxytetrahydrobiopterin dehydratase [Chloroflexota bacterium]